jgi:hypothetical protein
MAHVVQNLTYDNDNEAAKYAPNKDDGGDLDHCSSDSNDEANPATAGPAVDYGLLQRDQCRRLRQRPARIHQGGQCSTQLQLGLLATTRHPSGQTFSQVPTARIISHVGYPMYRNLQRSVN